MYLLVGLGNPGNQYNQTRHNIGFEFIDWLSSRHNSSLSRSKWKADVGKIFLWGNNIVMIKPTTYMNLSGEAVAAAALYYKISTDKIMVVHDDLDLPVGRVKMAVNRGAGGHKGITSMIASLRDKNFSRLRIGVGRPSTEKMAVRNFVLGSFAFEERNCIEKRFPDIEETLQIFISEGSAAAMNFINPIRG